MTTNTINPTNTIDEQHTEMMNYFFEIENETIPRLITEKMDLKEKIKKSRNSIDARMDCCDQIKKIKLKIKRMRNEKKNYFLNNSKYIFQYFEDKKNISTGNNNQNMDKLKSFFKIKSSNENIDKPDTQLSNKYIYQKYWSNVKNEIFNAHDFVVSTDICKVCRAGEMIPQDEEGILICNNVKCGKFIPYIVDNRVPSNKDPPVEVSYTAYIRLNHFKEILSQFQAKETTQIPEDVIEIIRKRIKKERIHNMKELTYDKMREILRKLGLNRYFEHIQYINSIFGIKPPIMNEELHETLCVLFIEIQKPWALFCPPNRTNFFNYTYTLYQLCVLLGQTQYLPYIPLMKDRVKQIEQDLVWEKVVFHLGWKFFPTV